MKNSDILDKESIIVDLRKYHRKINVNDNVNEKVIRERIRKIESIAVKIAPNHFNQSFVFGDYQQAIKAGIEKRIDEIKNDSNALGPYARDLSKNMAFACRERLDDIHSDFRYSYFSQLLEETISRKFQCYKSGCRYPRYQKSQLRDFFGRINGGTNVVYWDKRYIKQQINRLSATEKDNLTLRCCGKRHLPQCELNYQDQQSRAYPFIRALLGLEGNFEFLTNSKDKDDKFIITVKHDENDIEKVIERFQSIIIFKVIDGQIYVCLKPKQELRRILGKRFTFQFSVKGRQSDNSLQWPISTPELSDREIDQLYTDICQKIKNL